MEITYEELSRKTVAQLRAIAEELNHEKLHGHSTMHKSHLLPLICEVLGLEAHEHHEVVGINKTQVKQQIRRLKAKRDALADPDDRETRRSIRREIHALKRKIRRSIV